MILAMLFQGAWCTALKSEVGLPGLQKLQSLAAEEDAALSYYQFVETRTTSVAPITQMVTRVHFPNWIIMSRSTHLLGWPGPFVPRSA